MFRIFNLELEDVILRNMKDHTQKENHSQERSCNKYFQTLYFQLYSVHFLCYNVILLTQ